MESTTQHERLEEALGDRYTIEGEIGRGGMATVYLARDLRHDRPVALKVLSDEVRNAVTSERFLSEIRTAANLSHPHILALYDSGDADGLLYYVMPYVEGESLKERIAEEGQLSLDRALEILKEVGDALSHAHDKGFVHRDIKPSNVLLSSGHALLADFGVAKALGEQDESEGLTRTGVAIGTPTYMSPEQGTGSQDVDHRSDVYSLACVFYEMLVGEPPFTGPSAQAVLARHAFEDVPSIGVVRPDLPEHIERAVRRALAKTPADRFDSVDEFVDALSGSEAPVSEATETLGSEGGVGKALRRLDVRTGGGAIALVAVASAATVVLTSGGEESGGVTGTLDPDRVVVAPLENRTGNESLSDIGRMGSDWITEGLHRTGVVDVVPSLSAFQAASFVRDRAQEADTLDAIQAMARETGAGKVISGSYYMDGDSLLFQMQITDATTGRLMDALDPVRGSPQSPSNAISELRNRVMGSLAVNLDERLAAVNVSAVQPPIYEAYQAFDRGMGHYLESEWREALEPFYRAFDRDTTFAVPLLYAAFSHSNLAEMSRVDSLASVLDARRESLTEYHRHWLDYLAARVRGDNAEALAAIRQAAQLAPGSKAVYNYAYVAQLNNRPAEAVEALRSLDPERGPMRRWFPYWELLTDNLHRLGRHEEELEAARRTRELYPDRMWGLRIVGRALAGLGRTGAIDELLDRLGSVSGDDQTAGAVMTAVADELRIHEQPEASERLLQRARRWYEARPDSEQETRAHRIEYASVLNDLRRWEETRTIVRQLVEENPDDLQLVGWLGALEAWTGNETEARRIMERMGRAEQEVPYSHGAYTFQQARIAAVLGNRERAVDLLRRTFARGYRPPRHPDINLSTLEGYRPFEELMAPEAQ